MAKTKRNKRKSLNRKKRKSRHVGNKKFLIHLEKKRSKAKKRLVNISCSIRTAKLRRNKCLRGKKEMMRLTKRICRLRRERNRLQTKLKKLHVKNNKCF